MLGHLAKRKSTQTFDLRFFYVLDGKPVAFFTFRFQNRNQQHGLSISNQIIRRI